MMRPLRTSLVAVVIGLASAVAPAVGADYLDIPARPAPAGPQAVAGAPVPAAASAEAAARAYLGARPVRSGLARTGATLVATGTDSPRRGIRTVRLRQHVRGLPVIGADTAVTVDGAGRVVSAVGATLDGPVPPAPGAAGVEGADARTIAAAATARDAGVPIAAVRVESAERALYDTALAGGAPGPPGAHHVWDVEVRGLDDPGIGLRVLVDAGRGGVLARIPLVSHALDRRVCDAALTQAPLPCANPVLTEGGDPDVVGAEAGAAYRFAGDLDAVLRAAGTDGLDVIGGPIVQTVRYCEADCPVFQNAFWDGQEAVYGPGFATDDVVAHELTHGITERTADLFYWYQSGAISESMSDVFGEITDLLTARAGEDDDAQRWFQGEALPGGPIRDMLNPTAFGDPDRTGSPNYRATPGDEGGVHSNSGVGNKAAYLMADGGTFNGRTVQPVGRLQTLAIHHRALTTLLRSGSDYRDLAVALPAACGLLVGQLGIEAADCAQVEQAVLATEMHLTPAAAALVDGPGCTAGLPAPAALADDFEDPASGRWISGGTIDGAPTTEGWFYGSQYPPGYAPVFARSGVDNLFGDDVPALADVTLTMAAPVVIPPSAILRFSHATGFDGDAGGEGDGGVLEYTADGGATWVDAGPLLTHNGYSGSVATGSQSALAGRAAWTLHTRGHVVVQADLSPLTGQSVSFRFRLGTDATGFGYGWFIDDLSIVECDAVAPDTSITAAPAQIAPGESAAFTFAASEAPATFECAVDGRAFTPCPAAHVIPGLALGPHVVRVRAVDKVGQVDPTPAEATVVVAVPPVVVPPAAPPPAAPPVGLSPPSAAPAPALAAATLGSVRLASRRVRRGTPARLVLAGLPVATPRVRVVVQRRIAGRRAGRICRSGRSVGARCVIFRTVRTLTIRRSARGAGTLALATAGRRGLAVGAHRLRIIPLGAAGVPGRARALVLTVLPPPDAPRR